jgi:hypothetical protein
MKLPCLVFAVIGIGVFSVFAVLTWVVSGGSSPSKATRVVQGWFGDQATVSGCVLDNFRSGLRRYGGTDNTFLCVVKTASCTRNLDFVVSSPASREARLVHVPPPSKATLDRICAFADGDVVH